MSLFSNFGGKKSQISALEFNKFVHRDLAAKGLNTKKIQEVMYAFSPSLDKDGMSSLAGINETELEQGIKNMRDAHKRQILNMTDQEIDHVEQTMRKYI